MTAQEDLKLVLRDHLGPTARSHGYTGSAPTWRKSSTSGSWAAVNVQSSSWSSARLRCVVNVAFAPEPWPRRQREHLGASMPKAAKESLGLFRERLHPEGTPDGIDGWWEVSDLDSALLAVADMKAQLERSGWPVLDSMFAPEAMLARVREGDLGMQNRSSFGVLFARAEALLVMVDGPTEALKGLLRYALDHTPSAQREHAERFDTWVRNEAAKP